MLLWPIFSDWKAWLAVINLEVTGYILVISKYVLCIYYVQEFLQGITELPEQSRGK